MVRSDPILVWWDYLLTSEVSRIVKGFKIVIPTDAQYAGYYCQAVSKAGTINKKAEAALPKV